MHRYLNFMAALVASYLKKLVAEPFDTFTFSSAGLSVYQLGDFGTARKTLQAWQLK